jgi:hypothetical protein
LPYTNDLVPLAASLKMGSEAANVHLGTKRQVAKILRDLQRRRSKWLHSAAGDMVKAMERDWKKYRES